jgi:hypothetical protein
MKTTGWELAATLAADGYRTAPGACADCLVPENLMRGILGQALGVPQDAIDLACPSTPQEER